jgi:hypothetical protein
MRGTSRFGSLSGVILAGGTAACVIAAFVSACGARTGLEVPPLEPVDASDAGKDTLPPHHDADAEADVKREADVEPDAADRCPDAGATYIYLVTESNNLIFYDPPSGTFGLVHSLDCPLIADSSPFSMAVDRTGLAYVLYADGELFKVSTKDGRCKATAFLATDADFVQFGMGFTANHDDPGESLYVLGWNTGDPSAHLGRIDVESFALDHVGDLSPRLPADGELTGTADGRLFSYAPDGTDSAQLVEIDPATAKILSQKPIPVPPGNAWAFAFFGGDFYLFNAPTGDHSNVTRYRPTDGSIATVTTYPELIVGAGVSTCAPTVEP